MLSIVLMNLLSQYTYAAPTQMPIAFYISPHAIFVRIIYLLILKCINGWGQQSIFTMDPEMTRCFYGLFIVGFAYFCVGILFNEPKFRYTLYKYLVLGVKEKVGYLTSNKIQAKIESYSSSEINISGENDLDMSLTNSDGKSSPSTSSIVSLDDYTETSADNFNRRLSGLVMRGLDSSPEHVLVAHNITKTYVSITL